MATVAQRDPTEVNTPTDHLRRLATAETPPPAHEWQPVALAVLEQLDGLRKATGWDTCSVCGAWAESRDEDGRGLECCAVLCAGCGEFIEGKFAEDCDKDSDARPICDQCAIDRDHESERHRRAQGREVRL